jgi:hypothetical protein
VVGEATVVGTRVVDCNVTAGFSVVTVSATRSTVLNSTVDVSLENRPTEVSATLLTGPSDAFLSTRIAVVDDRFFGRCADGVATSGSVGADSASGSSAGPLSSSVSAPPVLVSVDVVLVVAGFVEDVDVSVDAPDLVVDASEAACESELASADADDSVFD